MLRFDSSEDYKEPLCMALHSMSNKLLKIDWIENKNVIKVFNNIPIVSKDILNKTADVLEIDEIGEERIFSL